MREKLANEDAKQLSKGKTRTRIFELTAEQVAEAVTAGRDGRLYFLVLSSNQGETEVALERFEPTSGTLERLPLAMPEPGRGTMTAGKDGLYIASFKASSGIWRLTWDQMEQAAWTPVEAMVGSGGDSGDSQKLPSAKRLQRAKRLPAAPAPPIERPRPQAQPQAH